MLSTYLQDHHAGSTAGLELARRSAGANKGSEYGAELAAIADEIAADKEALERVMEELGASPSKIKDGGAWVAEKVGRLKPNNSLLSYSPLSRLIEIEGLVLGVTGKLALWKALGATVGESAGGQSFAELTARAESQRQRLEDLRLRAVGDAFGAKGQPASARPSA